MHSKNAPTLFDNLLNVVIPGHHDQFKHKEMIQYLGHAERYVLDAEASTFLGHLLKEVGPLMLRQHEFARAPHEYTWIEIDFPAYLKALDGRDSDITTDSRVGYFIVREKILFFVSETPTSKPMLSPYWFILHEPTSFQQELETAQYFGRSRLTLRHAILGMSGLSNEWWRSDEAANICRGHQLMHATFMDSLDPGQRGRLLETGAGSLKQALVLLLLLTRPGTGVLHLSNQDRRRGLIRGKSRVLASHHKVTLHLNRVHAFETLIHNLSETGIHHRYHSVRGHWAQTRRITGCTHDWEPVDPDHYFCLKGCGAKRWWKKHHHRGDPNLGSITKEYDVTE